MIATSRRLPQWEVRHELYQLELTAIVWNVRKANSCLLDGTADEKAPAAISPKGCDIPALSYEITIRHARPIAQELSWTRKASRWLSTRLPLQTCAIQRSCRRANACRACDPIAGHSHSTVFSVDDRSNVACALVDSPWLPISNLR